MVILVKIIIRKILAIRGILLKITMAILVLVVGTTIVIVVTACSIAQQGRQYADLGGCEPYEWQDSFFGSRLGGFCALNSQPRNP